MILAENFSLKCLPIPHHHQVTANPCWTEKSLHQVVFEESEENSGNPRFFVMTNRMKPELDNWCIVELIDFSSVRQVSLSTIYLAFIRLLSHLLHITILLKKEIAF